MDAASTTDYDVAVIGGGAAGLSASIALARSRRSVIVIDAGEPRNAVAEGVHNFLTRDGMAPAELLRLGREEATGYGVDWVDGAADTVLEANGVFTVVHSGGAAITARRVLVTTGLRDVLPDVPGLRARWGRDVLHCPFCHGWEVRDRRIGILATTPMAAHQALMFRQLSDRVTVVLHSAQLAPDDAEKLEARGIEVVEGAVASLEVVDDRLTGVRLSAGVGPEGAQAVSEPGRLMELDALVVAPRFEAADGVLASLGLRAVEHPAGLGTVVEADAGGQTSIAGVWVAGNVADPMAQVMPAAGRGLMVGAAINGDLIAEETAAAVERARGAATRS
ncbi:MAG: hypothetical protein RI885_179 [Actinomycetota bacterium]|jgi:thioredoxin reductase